MRVGGAVDAARQVRWPWWPGRSSVTFVAGLVFAWLRLRSRSLVAPVLAHVATNGLALVAAWAVAHQRLP